VNTRGGGDTAAKAALGVVRQSGASGAFAPRDQVSCEPLGRRATGPVEVPLVTTAWLAEHLGGADLAVVEVSEHPELYEQEGHIPSAVRLDWKTDLQDPLIRDPIPRRRFEELMGARGIGNPMTVVLYGDKSNWFAAYGFWYLRMYGHADIRILDGGRQKWTYEHRALTTETPAPRTVAYTASERDETIRAHRDEVRRKLFAEGVALVDVRSWEEYAGELTAPPGYEDEAASRAGHIPGAHWIPWATAVNDDSTFKTRQELATIYAANGVTPDKEVIVYCRIGERSAHTWFVLHELLGYRNITNYDGSWTEWGNLVGVPIEKSARGERPERGGTRGAWYP
jgi:thiosulfate/3-mercaptopyruvate sulfurtransferase